MFRFTKLGIVIASIALVLVAACESSPAQEPTVPSQVGESQVGESPEFPPNRLIKLVAPLDDPDHYCLDIRGWGSNIRLQESLQAHTCKPSDNRDQQYTYLSLTNQIYSEEYDLCVQPESLEEDSQIFLRECSDAPLQKFTPQADGLIRHLADGADSLCIAIAPGEGHVINAIHKRRELFVNSCDTTDSSLITWEFASGAAGTGS
jgi:hypothetical protein